MAWRLCLMAVAGIVLLAGNAFAAPTAEQKCQGGRHRATGKYENCVRKNWIAFVIEQQFLDTYRLAKCWQKYDKAWTKLQALTGTSCAAPRFVDNGNGTVTDRLSGLQWEKKDDLGGIHDKDDLYTWSTNGDGNRVDADGTAYTTFLVALNAPACFAGQCDWRLPTIGELASILLPDDFPCTVNPCINSVFGTTQTAGLDSYWTSTTYPDNLEGAWQVSFETGHIPTIFKDQTAYVRAVRGP